MKILLVNDYKTIIGGTEIYLYELKEELERRGHIVELFTSDISKEQYIFNLKNKSIKRLIKQLFNIQTYWNFKNKISKFNPDIIHLHNIFYELSPSILLAKNNIPIIMTVHDAHIVFPVFIQSERTGKNCKQIICRGCINCIGLNGTLYEIVKRNLHKYLLKNIDLYIGNSQFINEIIERFIIGKTIKMYYGFNLFNYSDVSNNQNILYIGRLSKEKGLSYAIKALPEILKTFPKTILRIVGNGEYEATLENLVKELKLEANVFFIGSVGHLDIQKYYEDSAFIIVPSTWDEPFGKVGVEAMSAGRPVIASRVGGIPEWLEDGVTGYLVQPGNSKQIAEKSMKLFSDRNLLQKMGKNARRKAEEYSFEQHVPKLENIYKTLVNKDN